MPNLPAYRLFQKELEGQKDNNEMQSRLWQLLAVRTRRYTMGDSSSVPVETARELLRSITFTVGMCLQRRGRRYLERRSLEELFEEGQRLIWSLLQEGPGWLAAARSTAPPFASYAYRDTLQEIGAFLRQYDYRFFAHDIPGMITYPLACPVSEECQGIEYIRAYLDRLCIENRFLQAFDQSLLHRVLRMHCADYENLPVNLFEPIFANAAALAMADREAVGLWVDGECRETLARTVLSGDKRRMEERLTRAVNQLCACTGMSRLRERAYLEQCVKNLLPRMRASVSQRFAYLFLDCENFTAITDQEEPKP